MVYALLFTFFLYFIASSLSIQWIHKQAIMNRFQKIVHTVLVLVLPVFWIGLIRMIYKPIPGYTRQRWKSHDSTAGTGGYDDYSHWDSHHDSGADSGGD